MKHLDLFSGIGGFALAAEWAFGDVEHTFCDNEPFCKEVLKKHWPNAKIYDDIRQLKLKKGSADIITGGFPCQPFSSAGKRRGTEDDRHLWPEMFRVIQEVVPEWVIAENVSGLLTWNGGLVLKGVLADLESAGYEARLFVLPACGQNAPHRRNRLWFVAHSTSARYGGKSGDIRKEERGSERDFGGEFGSADKIRNVANATGAGSRGGDREASKRTSDTKERSEPRSEIERCGAWNNWPEALTRLCPMDDGIPRGLAERQWRKKALKATGNAIVPQVAYQIMMAIKNARNVV